MSDTAIGTRRALGLAGCLVCVVLLGLAGCATDDEPNPHGAEEQLEELVGAWRAVHENGGTCEQNKPEETPLIDCERIRQELTRLAIEFPNNSRVLLANAIVAFETGRPEEAQKELDAVLRLSPADPDAAVLRARIAISEGNLRFARRLLDQQIELTPDHTRLLELSATVHYLNQNYDDARRELRFARQLGAPAWRVAYHEGLIAEAQGDFEAAEKAYSDCLEGQPDFAPARSRLRALAVRLNRPLAPAAEPPAEPPPDER